MMVLLILLFMLHVSFAFSIGDSTEKHFKSLRQLTFGGDNAEAYFSPDGKKLVFQSDNKRWNLNCDQIFLLNLNNKTDSAFLPPLLSTGKGRATCAYFLPDNEHFLYSSTHLGGDLCPQVDRLQSGGRYVWPIYPDYDIFVSDPDGKIVKRLTDTPGYDAEAVVSPNGDKIVFTSIRSGDLELWMMNIDGSNPVQITSEPGYDGGATFSPDGNKIVFRASRPKTTEDIKEYKDLLSKNLVSPSHLELFISNTDGSDLKKITDLGKANWAPCFHPSGKKIVFSSNHHSQKGHDFQLFMVNDDGSGLEQITTESPFNSFPMFSPDGKYFVFSSNRNNSGTHDTNVFLAEWGE